MDLQLRAKDATLPDVHGAEIKTIEGINYPVSVVSFPRGANRAAFWDFTLREYTTGEDVLVDVLWMADDRVRGVCRLAATISKHTPGTDTESYTAANFPTETIVDATKLATQARRLQRTTITLTGAALDGCVVNDDIVLRVRRLGLHVDDTLLGDIWIRRVEVVSVELPPPP